MSNGNLGWVAVKRYAMVKTAGWVYTVGWGKTVGWSKIKGHPDWHTPEESPKIQQPKHCDVNNKDMAIVRL